MCGKAFVVTVVGAHDDCLDITTRCESDFGLVQVAHLRSTLAMT